mmetsp:Transcript_55080/g.163977  ORF Transcript_55080/g.163977 Transcript_55080/m.163977 type:complete len:989 (-) Transcript_55080:42-3008(-)
MKTRAPAVNKMSKEEKLAFIKELEGKVSIDSNDTVFMVGMQLPLKVQRGKEGGWTVESKAPMDGRNFAFLPLLQELRKKRNLRVVCIGWPGLHVENDREQHEIEKLLAKHDCIPVFPPRQEFENFISFCLTFLWPVFHDVMLFFQTANPRPFNEQGWAAYTHINNEYARAVVRHSHESDLIWIHDYHLLMMPTFIARRVIKANIGFYLHTPFPSSDSFKSLPVREELLSGMLCADQIGFQFFAYARSFLVSIKRIYGLDPTFRAGGFMGLEYNGRDIMIKVAHFPYPFRDTQQLVLTEAVTRKAAEVRSLFKGKTVFVSMDRCDNLSGLLPKFRAFKRFLRENPSYRGKAVLVQYCFESAAGYETTSTLLDSLRTQADAFLQGDKQGGIKVVEKTEGSEGDEVDIYLRVEKMDRVERLAVFRAADVLLDTSVKAGLNLMPFEFITAHHDDQEKSSVVIVSEFSGCSRVLLGSLRINPWNTAEVVSACGKALAMAEHERKERLESNLLYASENSPMEWFEDFLTDLRRAQKKEGVRIEHIGFGAKLRQVVVNEDFRKLDQTEVLWGYRNSKNRVLFLDNEGTLAADKRNLFREYGAPKGDVSDLKSQGSAPNEHVLNCLRAICSDHRNTVVILSGRKRGMLEEWFGNVPRIGLAAERGFYYKLPLATGDQWNCMSEKPDSTWRPYAFEIMRQFVKRTQGSFIEDKGSALVWQYRDADQHFGSWQAKELSSHLKELLFGFEVDVIDGKGYVEVKLRGVNKGVAVTRILAKVAQTIGDVDFVLSIGDDRSDEDMFEAVNQFIDPCEAEANVDDASQLSTTDGGSHSDSDPGRSDMQMSLGFRTQGSGELSSKLKKSMAAGDGAGVGMSIGMGSKVRKGLATLSSSVAGDLRNLGGNFNASDELVGAPSQRRFFTCTVGRKPSAAKFFLDDVEEVSELLSTLKSQHEKQREAPPSYHTWSGGDMPNRGRRVPSMPALSSLTYGRASSSWTGS